MMDFRKKWLQPLEDQGRLRALAPLNGIDFSSNDYLGMSQHPRLRAAAIAALERGMALGAGGARLLRGNHPAHAELEEKAAEHFNAPRALFFANGFSANTAILSTLPDRHDVVLFDELAHASMRDGLQAGTARKIKIPHNNLQAFADTCARFKDDAAQLWIVVESLYSMDGDFAPLPELLALAKTYDTLLVVDEAHATGIYGANGRGLTQGLDYDNLIVLHTCGKALGVAGGIVCARADIIDTLINRARPFIYSTAPMPLQAHLVMQALQILEDEPQHRQRLFALMEYARKALPEYASPSQILPVILGEETEAMRMAALMQRAGYDIRAIRPPTVPEGTARLRLSLNTALQEKDIDGVAALLRENLLKKAS